MANNPVSKVTDSENPQELFSEYDHNDEVPIGAYATLVGVFSAIFAVFLLLTRLTGRGLPERLQLADLALLGVATHKLSHLITNASVTSFIRAPVTELQEVKSPTNLDEKPRGEGLQKALGGLLTCKFCIGMWITAFFSYGLVLVPRTTRFVAGMFSILTLSDFMHQAYKRAISKANE
ncbi:MAG: DUF1360 domain-containing protein [Rubrobacteraceae bacterium]